MRVYLVLLVWFLPGSAQAAKPCYQGGKRFAGHWCKGATLHYCENGVVKVRARCVFGCYRLGAVRAYCQCPGGVVGGKYFCHQNKRHICLRSREAPGGFALRACRGSMGCQADGRCVSRTMTRAIDALATKALKKNGCTGLAVGVVRNARLIHLKGYGHRSSKKEVPITTSSVFPWASISKTVTAVAAMQMVENKHLELDKDIRTYVSYYPKRKGKRFITMRQLLSNTGGMAHYGDMDRIHKIWKGKRHSYPDQQGFLHRLAVDIFAGAPLLHPPGTRMVYSTFGFVLAGAAVSIIAQKKYKYTGYEAYVKRHIAQPAQMTKLRPSRHLSRFPIRDRVIGYKKDKGKVIEAPKVKYSWCLPGCGYISPIGDLARFAKALVKERFFKWKRTSQAMQRSHFSTRYGLGLFVFGSGNTRRVEHAGKAAGFRSLMRLYPQRKDAIVLMSNCDWFDRDALADTLARNVLKIR